jgi:hypothetical protein
LLGFEEVYAGFIVAVGKHFGAPKHRTAHFLNLCEF